jgi:cytochrome bd-type quinol oxidase subunit 2
MFKFLNNWRWESEDGMANDIGNIVFKIWTAIQWSWQQMTLLSALILIMILALIGLTWLTLSDRKKLASRAYWRGFKDADNK